MIMVEEGKDERNADEAPEEEQGQRPDSNHSDGPDAVQVRGAEGYPVLGAVEEVENSTRIRPVVDEGFFLIAIRRSVLVGHCEAH